MACGCGVNQVNIQLGGKHFFHFTEHFGVSYVKDLITEFITQGASAVVLSDAIFQKEAIDRGDFDAIYQRAQLAASTGVGAVKRLKLVCE